MGRKKSEDETAAAGKISSAARGGGRRRSLLLSIVVVLALSFAMTMMTILRARRRSSSSSSSSSGSSSSSLSTKRNEAELLPIYDIVLPPGEGGGGPLGGGGGGGGGGTSRRPHPPSPPSHPPLAHLTPIDPSWLVQRGSTTIDDAHRRGRLHVGHVLFVLDASDNVLFLRRSSDVVTCPGTWSVLGEHATRGEGTTDAVVRGIEEELGFVGLPDDDDVNDEVDVVDGHVRARVGTSAKSNESGPTGTFVVRFRPNDNDDDDDGGGGGGGEKTTTGGGSPPPLLVTIRNATEYPLYYIRHYGPRNDDRVDRQLTYMWSATFPMDHDEIVWHLDDEVADHRWISLEDAGEWLSNDARSDDLDGRNVVVGDDATADDATARREDDGPDRGDFCHGTIRSLYEVGLRNILQQARIYIDT